MTADRIPQEPPALCSSGTGRGLVLGQNCTWQRPQPGSRARVGKARTALAATMAMRPVTVLSDSTNLTWRD